MDKTVYEGLRQLAARYPDSVRQNQERDIPRIAFNIGLVQNCFPKDRLKNLRLVDIGGGVGLFSVACAALGMKVTLIDDFNDDVNQSIGDSVLEIHKSYGVEILSRNVVESPPDFQPRAFDAVTCFDSMEHWHRSPKALFHNVKDAIKPNGIFIIGVPNCVNMRKRITVPLG